MSDLLANLHRAAESISRADALLITAGAGMGIDSGLPDFRGPQGFWQAYPALGARRISFTDIACPQRFLDDPALAWGFYGHRLRLYREMQPHAGFDQLKAIAQRLPFPAFVVTSNVDGQFQKAGFPSSHIWEIHGSIHHLQCLNACNARIWAAETFAPQIDHEACQLLNEPPCCPDCGGLARPNILMFSDWEWLDHRSRMQEARFKDWLGDGERIGTVELGAGSAIPSIRRLGERMNGPLIRINPHEPAVARAQDIGIALGAREAIAELTACLAFAG